MHIHLLTGTGLAPHFEDLVVKMGNESSSGGFLTTTENGTYCWQSKQKSHSTA